MSILSERVLSIINWIQAAYSIWQFVRVAKFFKLPYAFTSSVWNGGFGATYPKTRKVVMMTNASTERDGFNEVLSDDELKDFLAETYEFSPPAKCFHNESFKIEGAKINVLLTSEASYVLKLWLYYKKQYPTVSDKAYLARNCYYFRARALNECIAHIMTGGYFCVRDYTCLIDQSSSDVLNQNFLRILSIGPLMLQARNLGFASAVFSGFVVLLDILNYFANQVWKFVKDLLIDGIKYFFNIFPKAVRLESIGILSSATEIFRYSDDSTSKIYHKKLDKFVIDCENTFVPEGCKVRTLYGDGMVPQSYCDSLPVKETRTYLVNGQVFVVEHEFCVNGRNFPCCNLFIRGAGREVRKTLAERNLVYSVHTFLSTLREVKVYPVVSCSGSKLAVCNPLELIENSTFKQAKVVDFSQPSVFTIT